MVISLTYINFQINMPTGLFYSSVNVILGNPEIRQNKRQFDILLYLMCRFLIEKEFE